MKVRVLKREAHELRIEVEGAGHTICNVVQGKLLENEHVDLAGYDVPHPLASNPVIYVRTKGKVKPEEVLKEAIAGAREVNKEFGKELSRALKKT